MSFLWVLVSLCQLFIKVSSNTSFQNMGSTSIVRHAHLSTCGKAYNTSEGFISYKPFQAVFSGERCSFTIGVSGAADYKITILYLGLSTNNTWPREHLVLTGVRIGSPPILTTYQPDSIGSFIVNDSNIVIVTFISSQFYKFTNSTGFALQYEAISGGLKPEMSRHSTHHVFSPALYSFPYHIEGDLSSVGFSTFVFLPDNNTHTGSVSRVWYENSGTICLPDTIFVYSFNGTVVPYGEDIWQPIGRIEAETKNVYIPTDEILLMVHLKNESSFPSSFRLSCLPS